MFNFSFDNKTANTSIPDPTRIRGLKKVEIGATIVLGSLVFPSFGEAYDCENHKFHWDKSISVEDLAVSASEYDVLRDHMKQIIGTGIPQRLRADNVIASLMEHKGKMLDNNTIDKFKESLDLFSNLSIIDCLSTFSAVNKFIRTVLVLDNDIVLNLTYFTERGSDIMAFSVDFRNENLITGRGHAKDIADRTLEFINSLSNRD